MSSDVAIQVSSLGKCYHIYERPEDRLKQSIMPRLQRLIGHEQKSYFREYWALKDVSFEVRKGETIGIIGRNGSGKSTLLQSICGTLTPTSGVVETHGRIAALLELGSGFNPDFTGKENVYMNGVVLGLTKQEVDARFEDIASFADIGDFIDQPIKTYSSGMYVRLAFAVIAHADADILVIDEALSVGDAFFVQKCMRFLRKFMDQGTVLFVSHDTGAVLNLCQTAIMLADGVVHKMGAPKEVTAVYLEKLYESQQGKSLSKTGQGDTTSLTEPKAVNPRDMRLDFINTTPYRNDIEILACSEDVESFGKGGAAITSAQLQDDSGLPLSWVVGGETIILEIICRSNEELASPIVGFMIKDRLGQTVFADNTYIACMHAPLTVKAGLSFKTCFHFQMPVMPVGDYTVAVSIAEGTQQEHIQCHWLHDALVFKVHSSSVCFGLIGVPISKIEMDLV